jgi:hypothetical protein
LQQFCGYWKNGFESPPVRIFRETQGYRISWDYPFGTITLPIYRIHGIVTVDIFGRREIAYDGINDRLLIAGEGVYFRDYERNEE